MIGMIYYLRQTFYQLPAGLVVLNFLLRCFKKLTLNSSKSTLLSPVVSKLANIFSTFSSEMSSQMDFEKIISRERISEVTLRKRMTSERLRLLLPSVSMLLNSSSSSCQVFMHLVVLKKK